MESWVVIDWQQKLLNNQLQQLAAVEREREGKFLPGPTFSCNSDIKALVLISHLEHPMNNCITLRTDSSQ